MMMMSDDTGPTRVLKICCMIDIINDRNDNNNVKKRVPERYPT